MKTSFFTFGQAHEHTIGEVKLNKDTIVSITGEDPRSIMTALFGSRWCGEYDTPPMECARKGVLVIYMTNIGDIPLTRTNE